MPVTLSDDMVLHLIGAMLRLPPTSGHVIIGMLQNQQRTLDEHGMLLQQLTGQVTNMSDANQDFQTELQGIQADVAKQTSVTNGVLVFIQGINQKLAEALARPDPAAALAAVKQFHADLNANTQSLVTATTENTPVQEPQTPVVPTDTVDTGNNGA